MPDYLGKDQRKTKTDGEEDKENIKGILYPHYELKLYTLIALDEGDIQILKTYVSNKILVH